jgi:hypothetical protein
MSFFGFCGDAPLEPGHPRPRVALRLSRYIRLTAPYVKRDRSSGGKSGTVGFPVPMFHGSEEVGMVKINQWPEPVMKIRTVA